MSLILDALKKLDRENSSRGDRTTNIAADIIGHDLPRPGKRIGMYVTTVFVTAVAVTLITYGVIVKLDFQPKSSPTPVSPQSTGAQITAPLPPPEPVRDDRRNMGRVPPYIQAPSEIKKSVTTPGEKKASQNAQSVRGDNTSGGAEIIAERTPNLSAATRSSLRISGIVWDDEPSKRIAVINGIYAKEGSIIEGVKILEIFFDRVRFSQEGLTFEIPLR